MTALSAVACAAKGSIGARLSLLTTGTFLTFKFKSSFKPVAVLKASPFFLAFFSITVVVP